MARIDGVIEAVRYKGDRIDRVRLYERRGAAFSDHVLLDRQALIARLTQGKRIVTGQRREFMAGTFDIGKTVALIGRNGDSVVSTTDQSGQDRLEGVPIF